MAGEKAEVVEKVAAGMVAGVKVARAKAAWVVTKGGGVKDHVGD